MKLAILSDTHGLLRPEVVEHLKTADAILHGGDINKQSIVDQLEGYAPLYIVRGNNDKAWAEGIPHHRTVTLGGATFYMVHNRKEVPQEHFQIPFQRQSEPESLQIVHELSL